MPFVLQLFTILDVKSTYFPPFVAQNKMEALRIFGDILADPQSKLSRHPGDYRLYQCGHFHVDTGTVESLPEGVLLVEEGLALVKEA